MNWHSRWASGTPKKNDAVLSSLSWHTRVYVACRPHPRTPPVVSLRRCHFSLRAGQFRSNSACAINGFLPFAGLECERGPAHETATSANNTISISISNLIRRRIVEDAEPVHCQQSANQHGRISEPPRFCVTPEQLSVPSPSGWRSCPMPVPPVANGCGWSPMAWCTNHSE